MSAVRLLPAATSIRTADMAVAHGRDAVEHTRPQPTLPSHIFRSPPSFRWAVPLRLAIMFPTAESRPHRDDATGFSRSPS